MVDIISYFLFFQSFGPYHFGFTLNLAVVGLLAGLIFSNQGTLSNILQKYSKKISIIISSSIVILSFIYILFTSEMRFEGVNFSIGIIEKLSIVVVVLISIVI